MPGPLIAPAIAAAGIGAGGNIASSVISNIGSKNRQREANKWNRESWHMQNAYNTPAAQMARFKAAGLNPNLIYGQGNSGNSGDISPAKAAPYEMKDPNLQGELGKYTQIKNTEQVTDNLEKQNELLARQAEYTRALELKTIQETHNLVPAGTSLTATASVAPQLADYSVQTKEQDIRLKEKQISVYTAQQQDLIKTTAANLQNLYATKTGINLENLVKAEKVKQEKLNTALYGPPGTTRPSDPYVYRTGDNLWKATIKYLDSWSYKRSPKAKGYKKGQPLNLKQLQELKNR